MSEDDFGLSSSDDEFGLSLTDEADFLQVDTNPTNKRKSNDFGDASVEKRPRLDSQALTTAKKVLREHFGLQDFRLKQAAAIERLLEGGNSVVVFPTGGGKSLCYQIPGIAFKELDKLTGKRSPQEGGITVVVSPLIALMKDQVDTLKRKGLSAAVLDSTKSREEYLDTIDSMRNGTLDILYCAPERLNNEGFVASMAHVRGGVRLLAVDEAHCISEWGHAFRPDYLKVARFATEIQAERVVCLTATATPAVATDVCKAFNVPAEGLFRTTTYRPNLRLLAESFESKAKAYQKLLAFLKAYPGPTIVYVTLQKHSEDLASRLSREGLRSRHFHAGMKPEEKASCQDAFMGSNQLIIVATIAFGMGIDKANIRNVCHYDLPRSKENYCQEIGRAGRDGLQSQCVLFMCAEDLHLRESFARGDLPSKKSVKNLLLEIFTTPLVEGTIEASTLHQSKQYDIRPTVLGNIYAQLELRFLLMRATTPKYASYTYKTLKPTNHDTSAAATTIRKFSKKAVKWTTVDVDAASKASTSSRAELVATLNHWNDNRLIELKTGGIINVYRLLKPLPTTRQEQQTLIDLLYKELEARELQDLDRMEQVTRLVLGSECFSKSLANHFGDALTNDAQECGHCVWCETHQAVADVKPAAVPWNSDAFSKVLQAVPDRDDARFLARIAFGISSPRVTATKFSGHQVFGSMEDHDFVALLRAFEKICDEA